MLINRENWHLHRPWAWLFAFGCFLCLLSMYDFGQRRFVFPGGSSYVGYTLGLIGGAIIVFEILLWPRKKVARNRRLGRVRTWMSAHIWLGLLTVPLAIVHAGVPWGGALASATMILLLLVIGSGVFGLFMQQIIPKRMTGQVPGETIHSQIEHLAGQHVAEADALLSATTGISVGTTDWSELSKRDKAGTDGVQSFVGASRSIANTFGRAVMTKLPESPLPNSDMIRVAYESSVRDYLRLGQPGSPALADFATRQQFFRDLNASTADDARFVVAQLETWCDLRSQLDRQKTLHRWLHLWLAIHLPMSLALLVLLVWHAIAASRYSGIL